MINSANHDFVSIDAAAAAAATAAARAVAPSAAPAPTSHAHHGVEVDHAGGAWGTSARWSTLPGLDGDARLTPIGGGGGAPLPGVALDGDAPMRVETKEHTDGSFVESSGGRLEEASGNVSFGVKTKQKTRMTCSTFATVDALDTLQDVCKRSDSDESHRRWLSPYHTLP